MFKRTVPHGEAAMLDSGHYIFITRERETVHLVGAFLDRLPP